MEIRRFNDLDIPQIVSLFYETVHSVNKQDYSQEQLDAWAPKVDEIDLQSKWKDSLRNNVAYVAEINSQITGFSDMTPEGHLDRLYIHKDFQRQGIASALVDRLESEARRLHLVEMDVEASIMAKPFFEHHGYQIMQSQIVERKGVQFVNFKMSKKLLD